jgi:hypothetical protein
MPGVMHLGGEHLVDLAHDAVVEDRAAPTDARDADLDAERVAVAEWRVELALELHRRQAHPPARDERDIAAFEAVEERLHRLVREGRVAREEHQAGRVDLVEAHLPADHDHVRSARSWATTAGESSVRAR